MAESEQTQVIQPKKKMGFGKKLIIILAVIVAFLGVCSLMIVHQNNQLEKKFYQVKSNKVVDNIRIVALAKTRKARCYIIDEILLKAIPAPREELSAYAPKAETMKEEQV